MICPSCYSASSRVGKTMDLRDTILRTHKCPACNATWATEEKLRTGSLVTSPVQGRTLAAPNSQGRPPNAVNQPSVATPGHGGVGGGLPSGSVPGPIPSPDPSVDLNQEDPRARSLGLWTEFDWRRRYGHAWCDKYGGTAIGGDGAADEKLGELLRAMSTEDRLAAQARAPEMFAEFLAEGGEAARARHRWAFFVGRFVALCVPPRPPTHGGPSRSRDAASAEALERFIQQEQST